MVRARRRLAAADGLRRGAGPQQINALIAAILPQLLPHAQVIHQAGPGNIAAMREAAAGLPPELAARYRPVAYLGDELPDVLAAADVVVARAGAGTVAELTAIGAAMVLIPLVPTGGDEQRRTAAHLAAEHAAVMLDGPDVDAGRLRETVLYLLTDIKARTELAANARRLGHPHAAEQVVDELLAIRSARRGIRRSVDPGFRR
jgi:UDP-N-acetylglucosamine--N-acetylmuramyl-(pentapeptide) pyrophosphoryl-undecaprenol N-acetylglucosamine transferase